MDVRFLTVWRRMERAGGARRVAQASNEHLTTKYLNKHVSDPWPRCSPEQDQVDLFREVEAVCACPHDLGVGAASGRDSAGAALAVDRKSVV